MTLGALSPRRLAVFGLTLVLLAGCVQTTRTVPSPAAPAGTVATGSCPTPASRAAFERAVLAGVNEARAAKGLAALKLSPRLTNAAQSHSCDMAAQGRFTHAGSDGSDLGTRLRRVGYGYGVAAENVARGFDTPERVLEFWLNSPGHRANILQRQVRDMGLGFATPNGDRPYWAMVLAG